MVERWVLAKMVPVSGVTWMSRNAGNVSSLWLHIQGQEGMSFGCLDVAGLGIHIAVVRWDDAIVSSATIQAHQSAIAAAPDESVLGWPEGLRGRASDWSKRAAALSALEAKRVHAADLQPQANVSDLVVALGTRLAMYQSLRADLPMRTRGLDDSVETVDADARARLGRTLRERSRRNETIRAWLLRAEAHQDPRSVLLGGARLP